jgi:hypothetical protein
LQVIEQLRLTLPIRRAICSTLTLVFLVEPQAIGSHPESPSDHSPRRGIYAIRGTGNAECPSGLRYRPVIEEQRKVEKANATAGMGHLVETGPGEQVMPTESPATDGGSPATTAVGEDVAASANDQRG